jgi:O-antigen/teichoic acid export membrane protein
MYLVVIKFVEVFTRAAFVVGISYSLGLAQAGQFGIVATLVGLFAFAFNWERQTDIQRRYVDASPEVFDRAVVAAVQFWGFNQIAMMPLFVVACVWMANLDPWQICLAVVIVSCEHVANQTYQMALISKRYWHFITIVAAKNVAVLLAILPYVLLAPSKLTIDYALSVWAIGQLVCVAVVFAIWLRRKVDAPHEQPFSFRERIFRQHRDSLTHFQIGFVAILMLQFDRLTVGALLPLDQAGLYFRHILMVSFIYQFFNVAFYNRALPGIFAEAKTGTVVQIKHRLWRELLAIYALVVVGTATAVGIDLLLGRVISAKYHLSYLLGGILIAGALIRVTADFFSALCHARMLERYILHAQLIALAIGGVLLAALSWRFGVIGTGVASLTISSIYLVLIWRAVGRLPQRATP